MKKAVILLGSVKYNKGSEAIGRGLAEILHKSNPNLRIVLSSNVTEANNPNIPYIDKYSERTCSYSENPITSLTIRICGRLFKNSLYVPNKIYKNIIDECHDADLIFFIGGDNFDKNYGAFKILNDINRVIEKVRKSGSKKILFDCSFNPHEFSAEIIRTVNSFDIVTARETVSYDLLKSSAITKPLYYFPDPAFGMSSQHTDLPEGFVVGKTIGVNVSPTVMSKEYGSNEEVVLSSYTSMINSMLDETNCKVLLIPHVYNNQDLSVLRALSDRVNSHDRVTVFNNETLNAAQIKHIISQCSLFVGARTHATIAAYSSCVPTIVLGYSVKSRGIAKDLFGKEDAYVIQVGDLKDDGRLTTIFRDLYANRDQVCRHLQDVVPEYIENAQKAGEFAATLLEGDVI